MINYRKFSPRCALDSDELEFPDDFEYVWNRLEKYENALFKANGGYVSMEFSGDRHLVRAALTADSLISYGWDVREVVSTDTKTEYHVSLPEHLT